MAAFHIHFEKTSQTYDIAFLEQERSSPDTVLVDGRHYKLEGDSEKVAWLKHHLSLSSETSVSKSTLRDRVVSLDVTNLTISARVHSVGTSVLATTSTAIVPYDPTLPHISIREHLLKNMDEVFRRSLETAKFEVRHLSHLTFSFPVILPSSLLTRDVATHTFLERRIGHQVLLEAHNVANSLNKDIIRPAPLEKKVTAELEQSFLATIPSYGVVSSKRAVAEQILREKISLEKFKLKAFSAGGTGADVYGVIVPGGDKAPSYVIKIIKDNATECARELSSLQQLSDLNLRDSHLSTAQAAAKFNLADEEETYTIFVQTAAKGKELSSLVEDAGQTEDTEREEILESIQKGLQKAAIGMAELHSKNREQATPISKETRDFNIRTMEEVYQFLRRDITESERVPLTQKELEEAYTGILESVEGNWGMSGYSHGDTHLDNLFFESSFSRFSFIDTPSFLPSVDDDGKPIGFPPYDFAWTFHSIGDMGFRKGLTKEEVSALQGTFKQEYEKAMGKSLAPPPARKLAALTKQFYFIWQANLDQQYLIDHSKDTPEDMRRLQNVIDHEVELMRADFF